MVRKRGKAAYFHAQSEGRTRSEEKAYEKVEEVEGGGKAQFLEGEKVDLGV